MLAQSHARGDRHPAPPSSSGNIVVALCDGETTAEIAGVKEGETPTSAQAREVADRLMTAWRQKNPAARWEEVPVRLAQAERAGGTPEGQAGAPPAGPQGEVQGGHTYGAFSERDQRIWHDNAVLICHHHSQRGPPTLRRRHRNGTVASCLRQQRWYKQRD